MPSKNLYKVSGRISESKLYKIQRDSGYVVAFASRKSEADFIASALNHCLTLGLDYDLDSRVEKANQLICPDCGAMHIDVTELAFRVFVCESCGIYLDSEGQRID